MFVHINQSEQKMDKTYQNEANYLNGDIELSSKASNNPGKTQSSLIYFTPQYYSNRMRISNLFKTRLPKHNDKTSCFYDENGYTIANPDADPAKVRYIARSPSPLTCTTNELRNGEKDGKFTCCTSQCRKNVNKKFRNNRLIVIGGILFILIVVAFII